MTDFANALIAQEDRVNEERYAAHRRRLDERLRQARRPIAGRRRALAAAAVLLVSLAGMGALFSGRRASAEAVAVVRPPTPEFLASADLHPYRQVGRCQVVAVARAGQSHKQGGEKRVPLSTERVLRNETRGKLPIFHCVFDQNTPSPAPDQRMLVYLTHSEEQGWRYADCVPLDGASGQALYEGVERCAALLSAPDGPNPKRVYEKFLCPSKGLDEAASCALVCRPDPRAADLLLDQLHRLHRQLPGSRPGKPDGRDGEEFRIQVERLAEALASLREARAAVPLAECVRRLPRGQRGPGYRRLPDLCREATPAQRAEVSRVLEDELRDKASEVRDHSAALSAHLALDALAR